MLDFEGTVRIRLCRSRCRRDVDEAFQEPVEVGKYVEGGWRWEAGGSRSRSLQSLQSWRRRARRRSEARADAGAWGVAAPDMISIAGGQGVVIVEIAGLGGDAGGRALSDAPRGSEAW